MYMSHANYCYVHVRFTNKYYDRGLITCSNNCLE